jgi:hypothetical protein
MLYWWYLCIIVLECDIGFPLTLVCFDFDVIKSSLRHFWKTRPGRNKLTTRRFHTDIQHPIVFILTVRTSGHLYDDFLCLLVVVRFFIDTQNRLVVLHSVPFKGNPTQCNLSTRWIDRTVFKEIRLTSRRPDKILPFLLFLVFFETEPPS